MTDQLPGRMPPWGSGMWLYPVQPSGQSPAQPVRIGDAERDEALDKLGDHFAAGRLTREELDERTEKAMGARYESDLEQLFRDLPAGARTVVARRPRPPRNVGLSTAVVVLVPLLVLAVTATLALHGAIFFGPVIWLLLLSGMGRRHHHR
jgi:hypothetical protein